MKKQTVFIALIFSFLPLTRAFAQAPEASISNKLITAKLYLPDPKSGYYRAMRFDWAGIVASLKFKDHEFFGQWFDKYDPLIHDAITGPVEGFMPVGYDTARPGETFLMIGVGMVKKADTKAYSFSKNYDVVNGGEWKITKKKDRVEFVQELKDESGYSYVYKKTLKLLPGKPVLVLEHSLKNTGLKAIETSVFDHNFFMIDKQPTGPDFSVKFPFAITADMSPKETVSFRDGEIIFNRLLKKGEDAFTHLTGFGNTAADYNITIRNNKTGSVAHITADQPIASLGFWTIATTISPEPYIQVNADPGKELKWTISYEFEAK